MNSANQNQKESEISLAINCFNQSVGEDRSVTCEEAMRALKAYERMQKHPTLVQKVMKEVTDDRRV